MTTTAEPDTSKFTAIERTIDQLFSLKKITVKDIEGLSKPERDYLSETINQTLQHLTGAKRDDFLNKIECIVPTSTKNQFWEYNHHVISSAISKLMRQHGCMPPKNAIAEETGLSRQTVAKHIAAYKTHPEYMAEIEQFKFMTPKMLASVYKFAENGDMTAARLFFEMVGTINKHQPNTTLNGQTNYIQINNTILSQENLSQLSPEQLNQIEKIIVSGGR
jgi:predicted transcriptional regulator